MTSPEQALRDRVVARAGELGATPSPAELRLCFAPVPALPEARLVAAAWGTGASENAVAGLLRTGEEPDLDGAHAIATLVAAWRDPDRPDAAGIAWALAFLLDPLGRWELVASADELGGWATEDGDPVTAPVVARDATGAIGSIRFWLRRGAGVREVVLSVDPAGQIEQGGGRTAAPRLQGGRP